MTDEATARIGDNRPPADVDETIVLRERLEGKYAGSLRRRDELLKGYEKVPKEITEDNFDQVDGFAAQLRKAARAANRERENEKEPFLARGRIVDGFFKLITEPLDKAKRDLDDRLTKYQKAKAEAERKARQEAERKAAEEAKRAEEEARKAADALTTEEDLPGAIAAEDAAREAEEAARKAAREAQAKEAELSRTRSTYGTTRSLRRFWNFEVLNPEEVDLEKLRPYLFRTPDVVDKAIRAFVADGGRDLRGVHIFEDHKSVGRG